MAGKVPGTVVRIDSEKLRSLIGERWNGSQAALAKACMTGPSTLSKLLGRKSCNVDMLKRIAPNLGMSYIRLLDEVAIYHSAPNKHRLHAGLTLEKLSQKSGISIEAIMGAEHGRDCYTFTAFCLAQALGITVGQYMGYEE